MKEKELISHVERLVLKFSFLRHCVSLKLNMIELKRCRVIVAVDHFRAELQRKFHPNRDELYNKKAFESTQHDGFTGDTDRQMITVSRRNQATTLQSRKDFAQ